jgi:AraC-like DNA-binding protein
MGSESEPLCLDELPDRLSSPSRTKLSAVAIMWLPPPHQYVIARRIERAQHLLCADGELGLAEVALRVWFSDQSQFFSHFKRIVGVTPRRFSISARKA